MSDKTIEMLKFRGYWQNPNCILDNVNNIDGICYDESSTNEPIIIDSVVAYLDTILKYFDDNPTMLFRGHSNMDYLLSPSVYRGSNFENENLLYNEAILRTPHEFQNSASHLDYLVKMQHYCLPTRIIDLTDNPLIALYFACCSDDCGDLYENVDENIGEVIIFDAKNSDIKFSTSDSVAMMCSLATFSYEDKRSLRDLAQKYGEEINKTLEKDGDISSIIDAFNNDKTRKKVVSRLLGEIRQFRPSFTNEMNPLDLLGFRVVRAKRANERIINQAGSFIVFGLLSEGGCCQSIEDLRYKSNGKKNILLVKDKYKILKELHCIGISRSSVFPEIENTYIGIRKKLMNDYS